MTLFLEVGQVPDRIARKAMAIGLEIDALKTNFFTTSLDSSHCIHIAEGNLWPVHLLDYLRSTIRLSGQSRGEVKLGVICARRSSLELHNYCGLAVKWASSQDCVHTELPSSQSSRTRIKSGHLELTVRNGWKVSVTSAVDLWQKLSGLITSETPPWAYTNVEQLSSFLEKCRLQRFGHVLHRPARELRKWDLPPSRCSPSFPNGNRNYHC